MGCLADAWLWEDMPHGCRIGVVVGLWMAGPAGICIALWCTRLPVRRIEQLLGDLDESLDDASVAFIASRRLKQLP